jgi:hypothetical protein
MERLAVVVFSARGVVRRNLGLHLARTVLRPVVRAVNDSASLSIEVAMHIALSFVHGHRIRIEVAARMPFGGFVEYAEIAFFHGKLADYRSVTEVLNGRVENRGVRLSRADVLHALRLSFGLQVHAESFRWRQR